MASRIEILAAILASSLFFSSSTNLFGDDEEKNEEPEPQQQVIRIPLPEVREPIELVEDGSKSVLFRMAGVGMFTSSIADLGTTEWGLTHATLQEGNPLATDRSVRITHHVVGPMAVWWTTERLHRGGHRKLALALRISLMAVYSYAAVHNAHKIQTMQ